MLLDGLRGVWPSHLHLLCQTSSTTGVCCVLAHWFSLLLVSGHWIVRILRRHRLMELWIVFIDALADRHVSSPYNNTGLTFELKKRTLVDVPIYLEFQTKNAVHTLPIPGFISASVLLCSSTTSIY